MFYFASFICLASASISVVEAKTLDTLCKKTNIKTVVPGWCVGNQCNWPGIICDVGHTHILSLTITEPTVVGTMEPDFNLPFLQNLDIENSHLSGFIPPAFFSNAKNTLLSLTLLSVPLAFDVFDFFQMTHMTTIHIVDAPVFGFFHSTQFIAHLIHLVDLTISYTQIQQGIPNFFFHCPITLHRIDLSHNRLSGEVDSTLCACAGLLHLDLSNNLFTSFPSCTHAQNFCSVESNLICDLASLPGPMVVCLQGGITSAVDLCGVCGGNSQECLDCAGVKDGTSQVDVCGVCNGDGLSCIDCVGNPHGTAEYDVCDVCKGDNSMCSDCNGTPNGPAVYDACDVCNGPQHGPQCVDCAGKPQGTLVYDRCDVCGGDNTACADCEGILFGTHTYDKCGVCGGHNRCLDCAGVPYGHAHRDRCGVCKGHGDTCGIRGLEEKEESLSNAVTVLLVVGLILCALGGCVFWWCVAFRRTSTPRTGRTPGTVSFG
jgi:hypothetical protein